MTATHSEGGATLPLPPARRYLPSHLSLNSAIPIASHNPKDDGRLQALHHHKDNIPDSHNAGGIYDDLGPLPGQTTRA